MNNSIKYNFFIALAALVLFVPFIGQVHLFDWDEINFAECAREMLVTKDYFSVKINYQPFWEKPPVFIWMQTLSMNIFGVNEFAARLPNAICGIITLLVLFNIGRKLIDEHFGLLWSLVYAGSFLPHFYFKSGIIDPWFNLFIFSGIYYFIVYSNTQKIKSLICSAVLIGLGVLTKGPVAVLVFGLSLSVFWVWNRFKINVSIKHLFIFGLTVLLVGGLWFLMLWLTGHSEIINEFILYQVRLFNTKDAGHGGPFLYHWIVLLIGCFPLSIFALRAFKNDTFDTPYQQYFKKWMTVLFWVVLILFSIVKTKIVHYSSLCYFPLSFLGAYAAYKLIRAELKWKKSTGFLIILIACLIGIAISALPIIDKYKQQLIASDLIKDKFAVENLKATAYWSGIEWLLGLLLIAGTTMMVLSIKKGKIKAGIIGIFVTSLITVNLASIIIVPRIEKYSQAAAIEFYEYLQGKDCYVETIGFKSYAHLFYSHKQPPTNSNSFNIDWLLHGDIDKKAYFVSKINSVEGVQKDHPDIREIYRKNGFVFWVRNPKQ